MGWFDLIELLLELLFEVVVPMLAELAADFGPAHKSRLKGTFPWLRIVLSGALTGALSSMLWPHHLVQGRTVVPGLSLLLSPLFAGRTMGWVGDRLRARGVKPTRLATIAGGALFAFGASLVRFLMVGLK